MTFFVPTNTNDQIRSQLVLRKYVNVPTTEVVDPDTGEVVNVLSELGDLDWTLYLQGVQSTTTSLKNNVIHNPNPGDTPENAVFLNYVGVSAFFDITSEIVPLVAAPQVLPVKYADVSGNPDKWLSYVVWGSSSPNRGNAPVRTLGDFREFVLDHFASPENSTRFELGFFDRLFNADENTTARNAFTRERVRRGFADTPTFTYTAQTLGSATLSFKFLIGKNITRQRFGEVETT